MTPASTSPSLINSSSYLECLRHVIASDRVICKKCISTESLQPNNCWEKTLEDHLTRKSPNAVDVDCRSFPLEVQHGSDGCNIQPPACSTVTQKGDARSPQKHGLCVWLGMVSKLMMCVASRTSSKKLLKIICYVSSVDGQPRKAIVPVGKLFET